MKKEHLLGKTLLELQEIVEHLKMPKYTAIQIAEWIYKKRTFSIKTMTNLSKQYRHLLSEKYKIGLKTPNYFQKSIDEVEKSLYTIIGNHNVETVYIPESNRATLCVSSQIGCKFGCKFCETGKHGFHGNLTCGEILNQILTQPQYDTLTNIVFMGMGEPLDNMAEVMKACSIITANYAIAWSPRRITISTVGILSQMHNLIEKNECHIAISLHSPFNEERAELMPAQKLNPIETIIKTLNQYKWNGQRRLSFEYIMLKNINDTDKHLSQLIKLLKGMHCRVNLINYHNTDEKLFKPADENQVIKFRDELTKHNITATIRKSRGYDIEAACGMLSSKKQFAC